MSSSQLTLTPSFFRGVGRKTTNQMITLYIHQPIGGSSCYKWSISIISQLVSDCLGVIIVTPPERNMSGCTIQSSCIQHPKNWQFCLLRFTYVWARAIWVWKWGIRLYLKISIVMRNDDTSWIMNQPLNLRVAFFGQTWTNPSLCHHNEHQADVAKSNCCCRPRSSAGRCNAEVHRVSSPFHHGVWMRIYINMHIYIYTYIHILYIYILYTHIIYIHIIYNTYIIVYNRIYNNQ